MENLKYFIIFVTVVLLVYGSTNYYVYRRVVQAAEAPGALGWALRILLLLLIFAYPVGRALGSAGFPSVQLTWIGAFWLSAFVYIFLIALVVDVLRISDFLTGWFPNWLTANQTLAGRMLLAGGAVLIAVLLTAGHIRTLYPKLIEFEVDITGGVAAEEPVEYRIAVFSDTHFGVVIGEGRARALVEQINGLGADAVFIIGDLIDEAPRRMPWLAGVMRQLDAPDGVWAVTGNHEFYAGMDKFVKLTRDANIHLLRDSVQTVGGKILLVGLDDETATQQFGVKRPGIGELLRAGGEGDSQQIKQIKQIKQMTPPYSPPAIAGGVNAANSIPTDVRGEDRMPVVLMHHTPRRIGEAVAAGVDLMLSGHTHDGQQLPLNYIPRLMFGVSPGHSTFQREPATGGGVMHFFLSRGAGTWGPPVRVLSPPDIALITLKFIAPGDMVDKVDIVD